jgi:hypothetical protein
MRRDTLSALVLPLTAVCALGLLAPPAVGITFGEVDYGNAYPNVGAVVFQPPDDWPAGPQPYAWMSCTLIHPRVVLTAAHGAMQLVQYPEAIPYMYVSFTPYALDKSSWHGVEGVVVHPDYNPHNSTCFFDVAVIILKEPVTDIEPATLPYVGFLDDLKDANLLREPGQGGVPFRVVGYGGTLTWPPPVLISGDNWRRFADSDFLSLPQGFLRLHQSAAAGTGGTSYGDSGGPAFWVGADGSQTVVGVTSWGDPMRVAMNSLWRVDVPETLDFIDAVINNLP